MARTKEKNPTGRGMSVQDIIDHGTPTQKAYKVLMEYRDLKNSRVQTHITEEEEDDIQRSMGGDDQRYYEIYLLYFRVYSELVIRLELFRQSFMRYVEVLKGMYATIAVEENVLTRLYNTFPPELKKKVLTSAHAKLEVVELGDGIRAYFKTENAEWWKEAKEAKSDATDALQDLVNIIHAFDEFDTFYRKTYKEVDITTLKLFRPRIIQSIIRDVKKDPVGDKPPFAGLSRKVLHEKMERGEYVGPHDKDRALCPYYDEIKANATEVKWWVENIILPIYVELAEERMAQYGK